MEWMCTIYIYFNIFYCRYSLKPYLTKSGFVFYIVFFGLGTSRGFSRYSLIIWLVNWPLFDIRCGYWRNVVPCANMFFFSRNLNSRAIFYHLFKIIVNVSNNNPTALVNTYKKETKIYIIQIICKNQFSILKLY